MTDTAATFDCPRHGTLPGEFCPTCQTELPLPVAPAPVSTDDQVECVRRELGYRRRVYPRRIAAGKMTQALADREIARMEAVLATLERVAEGERLL